MSSRDHETEPGDHESTIRKRTLVELKGTDLKLEMDSTSGTQPVKKFRAQRSISIFVQCDAQEPEVVTVPYSKLSFTASGAIQSFEARDGVQVFLNGRVDSIKTTECQVEIRGGHIDHLETTGQTNAINFTGGGSVRKMTSTSANMTFC